MRISLARSAALRPHQVIVHCLQMVEASVREHAVIPKGVPVARDRAVGHATATVVDDEMAEAREAVNEFGHVIGTEAGEGEVEEGNVREGRSPAYPQEAGKPALRHVQAELTMEIGEKGNASSAWLAK